MDIPKLVTELPKSTIDGPFTGANDAAFEKYINENPEASRIAGEDHRELYVGTGEMSNDQLVNLGVLGFDFAHNTLEEFKGTDLFVPVIGNDSTQFIEGAASKVFEATNTIKHVITTMDQLNEAYGGIVTNLVNDFGANTPEYEAALNQYEADLIIPMAATLNIGVVPPVDYPDIQSIVTALQTELGEGIDRLNTFINEVTDKVPDLNDGARMETLSHAIAVVAAVTIGASVTVGALSGLAEVADIWKAAEPTNEGVIFVSTGVGKVSAAFTAVGVDIGAGLTSADGVKFTEATSLDAFQDSISKTWKADVETSESEEFISASETFGKEFYLFERVVYKEHPIEWGHSVGQLAQDPEGNFVSYETFGNEIEGGRQAHRDEKQIVKTMENLVTQANNNAPDGISYVVAKPPIRIGVNGPDQAGAEYFDAGTIEIRMIINPVQPKGIDQPVPVRFIDGFLDN